MMHQIKMLEWLWATHRWPEQWYWWHTPSCSVWESCSEFLLQVPNKISNEILFSRAVTKSQLIFFWFHEGSCHQLHCLGHRWVAQNHSNILIWCITTMSGPRAKSCLPESQVGLVTRGIRGGSVLRPSSPAKKSRQI